MPERPARLRWTAALLVVGILAVLAFVFRAQASRKMPDFEVYWRAGARAAAAEPLYRASDAHFQLKYLPAFAVLAAPASRLPLPAAKALWFAASVAMLGAFITLAIATLPERHRPTWVLVVCAVLAMGKFYGHELVLGQVNLLFGVIVTGAVVLLRRGRHAAAGALLALAVVVKPYAVIFVPWLIARRDTRTLVAALAGLVVALLLPAPLYGVDGTAALHRDWWQTVTASTAPNLLNQDNVSIAAMFAKWLGPGTPASRATAIVSVALLVFAFAVVLRRTRTTFPQGLDAALLLTSIPLLSPQGWDYVFLLATPAVMFVVNYGRQLPAWMFGAAAAALALAGLSLFDTMGREAYAAFMSLSLVSVCFFVVIGALGAMRWRAIA